MTDRYFVENHHGPNARLVPVEERLWWISFCDGTLPKGDQFLGACIVRAGPWPIPAMEAHAHGCNPGGECVGFVYSDEIAARVPESYINRLLDRDECEAVSLLTAGEGCVNMDGESES